MPIDTKATTSGKKDGSKPSQRSQRSSRSEKDKKPKKTKPVTPPQNGIEENNEEGEGLSPEAAALLKEAVTPRSGATAASASVVTAAAASTPPVVEPDQLEPMDMLDDVDEVPKSCRPSRISRAHGVRTPRAGSYTPRGTYTPPADEDGDDEDAERKSKSAPRLSRADRSSRALDAGSATSQDTAPSLGTIEESDAGPLADTRDALLAMLPPAPSHGARTTQVAADPEE